MGNIKSNYRKMLHGISFFIYNSKPNSSPKSNPYPNPNPNSNRCPYPGSNPSPSPYPGSDFGLH